MNTATMNYYKNLAVILKNGTQRTHNGLFDTIQYLHNFLKIRVVNICFVDTFSDFENNLYRRGGEKICRQLWLSKNISIQRYYEYASERETKYYFATLLFSKSLSERELKIYLKQLIKAIATLLLKQAMDCPSFNQFIKQNTRYFNCILQLTIFMIEKTLYKFSGKARDNKLSYGLNLVSYQELERVGEKESEKLVEIVYDYLLKDYFLFGQVRLSEGFW